MAINVKANVLKYYIKNPSSQCHDEHVINWNLPSGFLGQMLITVSYS